jgi:ABC-2 type transport system permease protein
MRKIIAIAWKDTLVAFKEPAQWVFFLYLPLLFTFLLGGGFDRTATRQREDDRIPLLVVNAGHTPVAQRLLDTLAQSVAVRVALLPQAEADSAFTARQAPALLMLPADLDEAALASGNARLMLTLRPNDLNAPVAEQAVAAAAAAISQPYRIAQTITEEADRLQPFASDAARRAFFDAALDEAQRLAAHMPARLAVTRPATAPFVYDQGINASAGQLITWVFIPLLGICAVFAYERRNGTLRRLVTTPASQAQILAGAIVGQVGTALVQVALMVGFGIFVMQLPWGREPLAMALLLFAFVLAGAALGTLLGTFIKSEGQANGLSIMLGMLMALLGGCWYPLEIFPDAVRAAAHVLPTTWAMEGMLDLLGRGLGIEAILPNVAVLLGFAAVFFVAGVARFKFE